MLISNKAYDVLKFIAVLILPLAELVSSLAAVFGWEWGAAVVAVLAAIHSFIGSIIKITSDAYKNCSGENDG